MNTYANILLQGQEHQVLQAKRLNQLRYKGQPNTNSAPYCQSLMISAFHAWRAPFFKDA